MKTILITGASGDIGSQIAKTFANNNELILIYNKNKSAVEQLKSTLSKKAKIFIHQCDLSNFENVDKLMAEILSKHKKIDVLINCAGVSQFKQIQDITNSDYHNVIDSNLKSVIAVTKHVAKNMIYNKSGSIINISSMWGIVGSSTESLYSASKGAINTFTLSLAKELGPSGIRVNCICPGLIDTKMNNKLSKQDKNNLIENIPLLRMGKTTDVANLAYFLASEKASYITGQIISVDGGFTL